jgi:hypothetical protein
MGRVSEVLSMGRFCSCGFVFGLGKVIGFTLKPLSYFLASSL